MFALVFVDNQNLWRPNLQFKPIISIWHTGLKFKVSLANLIPHILIAQIRPVAQDMSVTYRSDIPTYKPQVKASHRACIHTLPRVIRHQTSPLNWGGLRHCHMSYSSGPRLSSEVGSSAAMCTMALDFASHLSWAPALPRVLWLRTSPLDWGGLRRCHVYYGSRPRLPSGVGSGAATCPMTLDLPSRLRWAPMLSCVLWLRTSPPGWGGLRCCHVSRGSLWAADLKHKEKHSSPTYAARHACF
jgi:hypothetical protein